MLRPLGTQRLPGVERGARAQRRLADAVGAATAGAQADPTTTATRSTRGAPPATGMRQIGTAYGFGLFVDNAVRRRGEHQQRRARRHAERRRSATGSTSAHAGQALRRRGGGGACAEFAFEQLRLHRLEICIVPRNDNSRRVMEKLAIREEGVARRYLEINGTWEDHVRYGITARGVAPAAQRDDDRAG